MIGPALLLLAAHATAAPVVFAVHVGVNAPPRGSDLDELRFADDDAVRMFDLTRRYAARSVLLATLDDESQRRHPTITEAARPPTRGQLEATLARIHGQMQLAKDRGSPVVFVFSYSGHGTVAEGGTELTLLDGSIDRDFLEARVASLPADATHLLLDACHAGGLVQGRGLRERDAEGERLAQKDADAALGLDFFQRHPHVGALIATSVDGVAHEWSVLESGVFTYELTSGLRGGADINLDGAVDYSEVAAFVAAANRAVADPRGRVNLVVEPPRQNRREPLVDRDWMVSGAYLVGSQRAGALGHLFLERDDGLRLLDVHAAPDERFALLVPAGQRLFVRTDSGYQAVIAPRAGERIRLADLTFERGARLAQRGSLDSALREGFFAKPYDRSYYEGYVDNRGLLAVRFDEAPDSIFSEAERAAPRKGRRSRRDDAEERRSYGRDDEADQDDGAQDDEGYDGDDERYDEPPADRRSPDRVADASGSGRDDERRVRPRTPSGRTGRADDSGGIGPTLGVVGAVGMGVAAALAGLGTLGLAGVAGYSMLEYSTTNLQVPAANALGRAFLFGTLTFLSGATTLVLGGCSGGLYWWTRPAEDE